MARLSQEIQAFLNERRFAVMATVGIDGMPQQTVMWYELRGDHIMMNTAAGRYKADNVVRDPRVSICIEDEYRYVTIQGRVETIDDQAIAQPDIYALARRYNPDFKEGDYPGFRSQHRITMLLSIDRVIADGFGD